MRTLRIVFLKFLLGLATLSAVSWAGADSPPPEGWKLVWRDEFNDRRLSPRKWNVLVREQSKHNELQYYLPDEVYLENGWLRLRSRVRNFGSQSYTSGRVDTRGKFASTYGRFEIRARLPRGQGLWPAHWLYPQTEEFISVTDAALVIGGGVAGIQAALDLADAGHKVYLVEKKPSIGGIMAQLDKVYPDIECSI